MANFLIWAMSWDAPLEQLSQYRLNSLLSHKYFKWTSKFRTRSKLRRSEPEWDFVFWDYAVTVGCEGWERRLAYLHASSALDVTEAYLLLQKAKRKTNARRRQGNLHFPCHTNFVNTFTFRFSYHPWYDSLRRFSCLVVMLVFCYFCFDFFFL